MYTLKSIVQRSALFGATASLVLAAVIPTAAVFADALNPLTERSLLLSSSAPGWQDTDGSGNSAAFPNSVGENYAPAGSGPNGKKTGETFTFTVSSTAQVQGFSLQYCTKAAGICQAPGNNTGDARDASRALNTAAGGHQDQKSDLDFVGTWTEGAAAGGYSVLVNGSPVTGWALSTVNLEDDAYTGALTGKNNYVTLTNAGGPTINNGDEVQIVFKASESTYITNPGNAAFFVKINTYSSATDLFGSHNENGTTNAGEEDHTVIDGGVTVANVMTDSIHITTKVLETMAFSVGTRNPDTTEKAQATDHATCERIEQIKNNRLDLGDAMAEFSLETGKSYDAHSYWRLSSNSSGGATVYYSGDTLANTVGDQIADMPTKANSLPGTEQFGLGFVDAGTDTLSTTFNAALALPDSRYKTPSSFPFITVAGQETSNTTDRDFTALAAQPLSADYANATGTLDNGTGGQGTAQFKFKEASLTTPEPIAQQNETVISCATAKMRYVANIGADTPAGVYTTKINYLAAPQY